MRRGSGVYVAIAILAVLTIAFGAGFYFFQMENQRLTSILTDGDINQLAETNEKVEKLSKEAAGFTEERKKMEGELADKEAEAAKVNRQNRDLQTSIRDADSLKTKLNNAIGAKNREINSLKAQLQTANKKANTPSPMLVQLQKELKIAKEQVKTLNSEVLAQKQARRLDAEGFTRQKKQILSQISQYRSAISQFKLINKQRESAGSEIHDGKVIEVDVDRDFAVVDLGSIHRVKPGMQFEVIRYRQGQWDEIASLEITKVMEAASTCVILKRMKKTNVCPQCGFKTDNTKRNCPYCRNVTADGENVVPLIEGDMREVNTMNKLDPIVEGDFVTNPVYSRDRMLTFSIAGYPREYSRKELTGLIKNYGGRVIDEIGADTDYLVLCQIPNPATATSPELKKIYENAIAARDTAKQLAIPVMREVELLRFIEK